MKILLTAFEPFNNLNTNSSLEVFKCIDDLSLIKLELPVSYKRARDIIHENILKYKPDFVINLGQAGGEKKLRIEKVALNYTRSSIADNDNDLRKKGEVVIDAPFALKTNLDIEDIVDNANLNNVDSYVSLSAGGYICNTVYYSSLYYNKGNALFIHLPYFSGQIENENTMDLELMTKNVLYYIRKIKELI